MAGNEQLQIGGAVYALAPTAHGTITETKLGENGQPLYLFIPDWTWSYRTGSPPHLTWAMSSTRKACSIRLRNSSDRVPAGHRRTAPGLEQVWGAVRHGLCV
jgi:hypothetical protein